LKYSCWWEGLKTWDNLVGGKQNMLRSKIIAIMALAMIGLASPSGASARGGGGGHGSGGFHGGRGGFHGGFGFRGGGFRGRGFGLPGPYIYGDYPYDYGGYYGDDAGYYLVTRRLLTRYGWRNRRVEVCDWFFSPKTRWHAGVSLTFKHL
jgi:hypothetical protein